MFSQFQTLMCQTCKRGISVLVKIEIIIIKTTKAQPQQQNSVELLDESRAGEKADRHCYVEQKREN